jgi:hypothetical protein
MAFLQSQRSLFESEDDFRTFVLDQVRCFIRDLRALDIEVSMRPNWNDRISSAHSTPPPGS